MVLFVVMLSLLFLCKVGVWVVCRCILFWRQTTSASKGLLLQLLLLSVIIVVIGVVATVVAVAGVVCGDVVPVVAL